MALSPIEAREIKNLAVNLPTPVKDDCGVWQVTNVVVK